jgi:hypothetical protein
MEWASTNMDGCNKKYQLWIVPFFLDAWTPFVLPFLVTFFICIGESDSIAS